MQIDSNWALFVEDKEVKWSFGNPDDEFLIFVVNFLTALSQIGEELFGQHGIAQIEFDIPRRNQGFLSAEVFIVSLMNKFFLIMSDPTVTLKLIETSGGIAQEVQDIMRITRATTEKLHDFAFNLARQRKKKGKIGKVTCVGKANVFRTQAFFRKIFNERKVNFKNIYSE